MVYTLPYRLMLLVMFLCSGEATWYIHGIARSNLYTHLHVRQHPVSKSGTAIFMPPLCSLDLLADGPDWVYIERRQIHQAASLLPCQMRTNVD